MVLNVQNIPTLELGQAQMFSGNFPPCSLSDDGRCNSVGNDGSGHQQQRSKPLERRQGQMEMVMIEPNVAQSKGQPQERRPGMGSRVGLGGPVGLSWGPGPPPPTMTFLFLKCRSLSILFHNIIHV